MRRPLFIARQSACPQGRLGRLLAWIMSHETAAENARVLDLLQIGSTDRVLELGFAHGRTLALASARAASGHVAGFEVSAQMVEMATVRNAVAIHAGRMSLSQGEGPGLPYSDGCFDAAYSVHTIYFWPDPFAQLREIQRVLAPGGRLVLAFRHDRATVAALPGEVYRHRTPEQISALVEGAGFSITDQRGDPPIHYIVAISQGDG